MNAKPQEVMQDHQARQQAALAHARIDSHETHCGERWAQTREAIDRLHKRISETKGSLEENHRRVVRWIIGGQGALILALLAAAAAAYFR